MSENKKSLKPSVMLKIAGQPVLTDRISSELASNMNYYCIYFYLDQHYFSNFDLLDQKDFSITVEELTFTEYHTYHDIIQVPETIRNQFSPGYLLLNQKYPAHQNQSFFTLLK